MGSSRRTRLILLIGLLVVLALTLYFRAFAPPAGSVRSTSNERGARRTRASAAPVTAPDVHLEALSVERPKPGQSSRNLFRFKPAPPPPAPVRAQPAAAAAAQQPGPPAPPPLPPIALKLTGTGSQGSGPRVAFLTDAFGRSIVAREGETIEGRYRVLKVNPS